MKEGEQRADLAPAPVLAAVEAAVKAAVSYADKHVFWNHRQC
jgi:hypothetical protein